MIGVAFAFSAFIMAIGCAVAEDHAKDDRQKEEWHGAGAIFFLIAFASLFVMAGVKELLR